MTMSAKRFSFIAQTRRNHALEHATIHVLNRYHPTRRLQGWSTPFGFYVHGDVPTQDVHSAVTEALVRLRRGERDLAIYPHCGTNLVTAGILVGVTAFLTMLPGDARSRRRRLPLVLLLSTLAMVAARPLGPVVQQYVTTEPNVVRTKVTSIQRRLMGKTPVHAIELEHRPEA